MSSNESLVMIACPLPLSKYAHSLYICSIDTVYFSYADLPYLDAIVKEVTRWRPVAPISVPHEVTQDDFYKGSYLPTVSSQIILTSGSIGDNNRLFDP